MNRLSHILFLPDFPIPEECFILFLHEIDVVFTIEHVVKVNSSWIFNHFLKYIQSTLKMPKIMNVSLELLLANPQIPFMSTLILSFAVAT